MKMGGVHWSDGDSVPVRSAPTKVSDSRMHLFFPEEKEKEKQKCNFYI